MCNPSWNLWVLVTVINCMILYMTLLLNIYCESSGFEKESLKQIPKGKLHLNVNLIFPLFYLCNCQICLLNINVFESNLLPASLNVVVHFGFWISVIIIYIRLFGQSINPCIYYSLAKVPGCDQYYNNIGRSLFQNGRQRAEIAISLIFVMFIEWIAWYK